MLQPSQRTSEFLALVSPAKAHYLPAPVLAFPSLFQWALTARFYVPAQLAPPVLLGILRPVVQ
jgi:hypothetical protein